MTDQELMDLARIADGAVDAVVITPFLRRFAELVADKEREACAKLLDDNAKACLSFTRAILQANADAIRAQGEN